MNFRLRHPVMAPNDGGGGGGGTPPAPPAPPTPPAPPPQPAVAWLPDADTETVGFIQNKAWDSPAKAVTAYRELEKFVGADKAQRGLVIPKEDAPPAEMAAFYERLGRPKTADDYKLPVPEGQSPDFSKQVSAWMHEAGISAKAGQHLASKWNEFLGAQAKVEADKEAAAYAAEDAKLTQDWGSEKAARMEIAKRTAKELGLTDQQIDVIEKGAGFSGVFKMLAKIGDSLFKEAGLEGDRRPGAFGMTPEGAAARKAQLMADEGWRKKAMDPNSAEWAEMTRLTKIISGT